MKSTKTSADAFDAHAGLSAADCSEHVSDDRSLVYRSGNIMTDKLDNLISVDREFRNNDHGVRVSRILKGVPEDRRS